MKLPFKYHKEDSANQHDNFKNREVFFLFLLTFVAIIALDLIFFSNTLDDSYITFRYSKHLSDGYGFGAWNISGERVEGYTSFLWMILLGGFDFVGLDIISTAKILGILSHLILVSVFLLYFFIPNKRSIQPFEVLAYPNEAVLTGMFLAFYLPLSFYATSGMETLPFLALIGLFFLSSYLPRSTFLLSILAVLLILMRPEGMLIVGMWIVFSWLKQRDEQTPFNLRVILGASVATVGLLLTYRLVFFGDIVPNTYRAKADGATLMHVHLGITYVIDWIRSNLVITSIAFAAPLIVVFSILRHKVKKLPINLLYILFLSASYIVYIIKVGGDNLSAFPYWRHFVQILPLIFILVGYTIVRLLRRARHLQLLVMVGVIIITNVSLFNLPKQGKLLSTILKKSLQNYPEVSIPPHNPYYIWFKSIAHDNTTIASTIGGELPFIVDAIHIDTLGLNTPYIAKHGTFDPNGPQDSKTDMDWVLDQHPDIIEGYISAKKIISGNPEDVKLSQWRYQMNYELLTSPVFQEGYCFVINGPYNYFDRAIFINISYWQSLVNKGKFECIPVSETTLNVFSDN
jgi:arabinofuranosyltransferase